MPTKRGIDVLEVGEEHAKDALGEAGLAVENLRGGREGGREGERVGGREVRD